MAARVAFRGGWTCSCVATSLPWVEEAMRQRGIIKQSIDIAQLGWRGNVSASAGTHDEGGCTDTWGQWNEAAIDVWRIWGWTMQRRDLKNVNTHAHGWPYGCGHLAPAAQDQARDWNQGKNGLVNEGPIAGRWPVKKWDVALDEGIQRMYTLDDIADAVLKRRGEIVKAVWATDGMVNNVGFAPGSAGNYVSASDALEGIIRRLGTLPGPGAIAEAVEKRDDADDAALKAQLAALDKKLDAVAGQVKALADKVGQ